MATAVAMMTQLPPEATPRNMGVKRLFRHLGDGSLLDATTPRKRARHTGTTITAVKPPNAAPRRILRARRVMVPSERKRAMSASTQPAKRMRSTPKPTSPSPPPYKFYTAEMRAAEARRMAREAPPTPVRQVEEFEIEAEGAGAAPPRAHIPPPPAVHAAMLEDGRVAVRIVRETGVMQAVVIDPPEWYAM